MIKPQELDNIVKILKSGGVGVLPTDTLYGLVGRAEDKKAVLRIKKLKKRSAGKPFIILISSLKDLAKLGVKLDEATGQILAKIWPGPVSVAFTKNFSARWPKNKLLTEIIKKTGPLVAPSANPEGLTPASTITEARKYFSDRVNFYLSANKKLTGQPSTLIKLEKGKVKILRQGQFRRFRLLLPTY